MLSYPILSYPIRCTVTWSITGAYWTSSVQAMRKVDRKNYVPNPSSAYEDSPQSVIPKTLTRIRANLSWLLIYDPVWEVFRSIGYGATISAPHMHAHACENLLTCLPQSGSGEGGRILDVGCGSGYREPLLIWFFDFGVFTFLFFLRWFSLSLTTLCHSDVSFRYSLRCKEERADWIWNLESRDSDSRIPSSSSTIIDHRYRSPRRFG